MKTLFEVASNLVDEDNKYTKKIQIPQYVPNNTKPHISALANTQKYGKLVNHINNSNVSESEKQFLRFAAARHIMFNYAKIADYYANAEPEMQRLMEESALVILDINDAIANGYVTLSKRMEGLIKESKDRRLVDD